MKDKLNIKKVANSLALTTAIIYLICILAVWIAPSLTLRIGNYLLHGIDISKIVIARSFGFSLITLINGTIAGWLTGALFALIYNKLR
jgi:hypothetical protein